nr:hypothetical protein Iba_chr04bCG10340 [Ipomoea batatas]
MLGCRPSVLAPLSGNVARRERPRLKLSPLTAAALLTPVGEREYRRSCLLLCTTGRVDRRRRCPVRRREGSHGPSKQPPLRTARAGEGGGRGRTVGQFRLLCFRKAGVEERGVQPRSSASSTATAHQHHGHTRTAGKGWTEELPPRPPSTTADATTAMKSSSRAAAAHHREKKRTPKTEERPVDSSSGKGSTAALARCFAPPEEKTVVAAVQFVVGKEATDHRNSHRYGLLAPEREAEGEGPSASSACSASAKLESKVTVAAWRRWEEQRGEHRHCCPLLRDEVRREGHCCVHGRMPGRSRCCRLHAVTERGVPPRSSASSTATAHQHHGHTRTAGKGWTKELPPRPPSTTADATTAMKSSPRAAAAHHREKKRTSETEERPVDSGR